MAQRHKVFVSYYHKEDQEYEELFDSLFALRSSIIVSKSVDMGDIDLDLRTETTYQKIRDEYISDATVTVVLIGPHTWQRKFVDWEIYSSLRHTDYNERCGLLGIFLPTYRPNDDEYDPHTIPPRLYDNMECDYAAVHDWSTDPNEVKGWIHQAFKRRKKDPPPDLRRPLFGRNHTGRYWQ